MVELEFGYPVSRGATAAWGSFVAKLNTGTARSLRGVGQESITVPDTNVRDSHCLTIGRCSDGTKS
jgi:hypothetical protein